MRSINTLVDDIYRQVQIKNGWFNEDLARSFSSEISTRLQSHLGRDQSRGTLRLSRMGPQCPRALWHSVHTPELEESLPPWAVIKLSYGHILEGLAIAFAKAAGHEVTGEQDAVHVDGIRGHRDCVIDGCVVDVKSCTSYGLKEFKNGVITSSFCLGYLDQLDGYMVGSLADPLVRTKDRGYILAIDKTLGHLALYEHKLREQNIRSRIKQYKAIVEKDFPPACTCGTRPDGKSGNMVLDTQASYSSYKHCCFENIRTFLYADGPRFFTQVVRRPEPHILEVDRTGKIVYN